MMDGQVMPKKKVILYVDLNVLNKKI